MTPKEKEADELYSYLYSHGSLKVIPYGYGRNRDSAFIRYVRDNVPLGARILDAGCGRGFLLKWLNYGGYHCDGTEIASALFEPGNDLHNQPVRYLPYSELKFIGTGDYDVVISNDVLEHLPDEESVTSAMKEFARITKKWMLLSVGIRAGGNPCATEIGPRNLHTFMKSKEYWKELYSKHFTIDECFEGNSFTIFGGKS